MSAARWFPPGDLRRALAELRERGVDFEAAWPLAWRQVRWPGGGTERALWRDALRETREAWQAAYELRPDLRAEAVAAFRAIDAATGSPIEHNLNTGVA